jgi:hypothetical protein
VVSAAQVAAALSSTSRPQLATAPSATLPQLTGPAAPPEALAVSALRMGSGVADVASLLTNLVDVSPGKLELGSLPVGGAPAAAFLDLTNRGSQPVTFRLGHLPATSVDAGALVAEVAAAGPGNAMAATPNRHAELLRGGAAVAFSSTRSPDTPLTSVTVPPGARLRTRIRVSPRGCARRASAGRRLRTCRCRSRTHSHHSLRLQQPCERGTAPAALRRSIALC